MTFSQTNQPTERQHGQLKERKSGLRIQIVDKNTKLMTFSQTNQHTERQTDR